MGTKLSFAILAVAALTASALLVNAGHQPAAPAAATPSGPVAQPAAAHEHDDVVAHDHLDALEASAGDHAVWPPSDDGRRYVHVRLLGQDETLLQSSWPGEHGSLEDLDPGNDTGPYAWGTGADLPGPRPLWGDILDFLHAGPYDGTVRIEHHRFADDLRVEQVTIPKHFEFSREATLTLAQAEATIRKNITAGQELYFLGQLPMRILEADAGLVRYRFDVSEGDVFAVGRSVGLSVFASEPSDPSKIRLTVAVPEEGFLAHNNCAVQQKLLTQGYYRLASDDGESLVLDRYNTWLEHALSSAIVNIEITYRDSTGAAEFEALKAVALAQPEDHAH